MGFTYPQGAIAVVLGIISFYGMTYVVIALNTGWRFGYWIAGATFGVLMVMLSIFWIINPVGPRGTDPRWIATAAAKTQIAQASLKGKPLTAPSQYPSPPWQSATDPKETLFGQNDALKSAVTNCISTAPAKLDPAEQKPCGDAQQLMPQPDQIPVINGSVVAVAPEGTDVRFTTEGGALLGEATIVPTTHDPRVTKDPIKGKAMGPSLRMLLVYDKGSVREPAFFSLLIFGIFFLFHLWGLHRAEQRRTSVVA